MAIELLSCDNTMGGNSAIERPSWDDIEQSIKEMDGETKTMVGLMMQDADHHMMIGGGGNKFILNINTGDAVHFLIDLNKSEDDFVEVMAGQPSEYPENQVVELNTVIAAAKYYFDKGEPDPTSSWLEL